MPEQLRLMAVHAHPDDESSKGAATMAKYVAEGVDVMVATCTGGERGDDPQPRAQGRRRHRCATSPSPPPEMDAAAGDPRRRASAGSASSTPGCPRATRRRRCPRAASPSSRSRGGRRPLVRLIREFRPHVDDDVRRERRLPAPRPHHDPQGLGAGLRRRRATPSATPSAGEPWQPLKLYYDRGFSRARIWPPRGAARRGARVAVRGVAGALEGGPARAGRSPPACRAPTSSRSVTGRCSRTPPRSTSRRGRGRRRNRIPSSARASASKPTNVNISTPGTNGGGCAVSRWAPTPKRKPSGEENATSSNPAAANVSRRAPFDRAGAGAGSRRRWRRARTATEAW